MLRQVLMLYPVSDYVCVKVQCYLWEENFSIKTFFTKINFVSFFTSFSLLEIDCEILLSGQLSKCLLFLGMNNIDIYPDFYDLSIYIPLKNTFECKIQNQIIF